MNQKIVLKGSGFSLIEILVAIALMSGVIIGIMTLFPAGYAQVTIAGRRSTMDHLAQQKLDYLRALPYTHTDLTAGTHAPSPAEVYLIGPTPHTDFHDVYNIEWTVTDGTGNQLNTKSVVVTVYFDKYNDTGTTAKTVTSNNAANFEYRTLITP